MAEPVRVYRVSAPASHVAGLTPAGWLRRRTTLWTLVEEPTCQAVSGIPAFFSQKLRNSVCNLSIARSPVEQPSGPRTGALDLIAPAKRSRSQALSLA
jgi:hypothetical protein